MRVVKIASNLMVKNDALAARLRDRFAQNRTLVVNILSSPGSGKTTLLEETLDRLAPKYSVGALVGDQATANDATRLARSGVPVHQITTAAECRLDAEMITQALAKWGEKRFDALFIENVGNLICPAEYDLGEDLRVVLFSVTEGEDKPRKYPLAFTTTDIVLVSKSYLAAVTHFDAILAHSNIERVHPGVQVLDISAHSAQGMDAWIELLETAIE